MNALANMSPNYLNAFLAGGAFVCAIWAFIDWHIPLWVGVFNLMTMALNLLIVYGIFD